MCIIDKIYEKISINNNVYQSLKLKYTIFGFFGSGFCPDPDPDSGKKVWSGSEKKVRIRNTGKDQNFYLDPDPYGNSEKTRLDSDAELNHSRSPTLQRSVKDIGLDLIRYFVKINLPWKYSCWLAS